MNCGNGMTVTTFLAMLAAAVLTAGTAKAQNNPQPAKVYVKMDFWESPGSQSAEAWHFDPNNNGTWTQLSNNPTPPDARPRARFEIEDLFPAEWMADDHIWFLGVTDIEVVTGSPGNFAYVSNNASYTEMIDRMIFAVDPTTADIGAYDPCGTRIWPIATGSELTPYWLYPHTNRRGGYGMRVLKEGLLESTAWLWKNPADVEEADVYIEFTLLFDMVDYATEPADWHQPVVVSWISAGGGCGYDFCLSQGQATAVKVGTPFDVPDDTYTRIVVAVPHVIDHTAALQLYLKRNNQNTLLIDTSINNSNNHYTSHKCEPDGGLHAWHNHSSASAGHLPVGGLSQWHGSIVLNDIAYTDEVFAAASFNIPSHATSDPTDHRALYMVFWHGTPPQGGGN